MIAVHGALARRRAELKGRQATAEAVAALERLIARTAFESLAQIYREFAVCDLQLQFEVDEAGEVYGPGPGFLSGEEYDPDREHEVRWLPPEHIVREIIASRSGAAVRSAGFLPIGACTMGGDYYYIREEPSTHPMTLYRVYLDWVEEDDRGELVPEAYVRVANSFARVIEVARIIR